MTRAALMASGLAFAETVTASKRSRSFRMRNAIIFYGTRTEVRVARSSATGTDRAAPRAGRVDEPRLLLEEIEQHAADFPLGALRRVCAIALEVAARPSAVPQVRTPADPRTGGVVEIAGDRIDARAAPLLDLRG